MFKHFLKPARVSAVFLLSCLAASIACASEKTLWRWMSARSTLA